MKKRVVSILLTGMAVLSLAACTIQWIGSGIRHQ